MDMSLQKLMRINRNGFFRRETTIPIIPVITKPPVNNTPPEPITYTFADFGENIINNHFSSDGGHSEYCQTMFNYVTSDFRDRCTSYQSYKTPELGSDMVSRYNFLSKCALINADLVFTPYVNSAYSSAGEYENFVLAVASHHENNGTDGNLLDDERWDITPDANTFLTDSIAVGARRDTPSEFQGSTSYGYGMEFFEDCSPQALDPYYPNKNIPAAFAELLTIDGINITSTVHPNFSNYLTVGEEITIRYSFDESTWQTTTVSEIISGSHIVVSTPISIINNGGIYGWHDVTLGSFLNGQAQSWAVPIVAGKLKVIKMSTNSDWEIVRAAARATARRNPTGIPEIDNTNWDIYRGFGQIQVQDAINYINNL